MGTEGVDGLVRNRPESFQNTLSYHDVLQLVGDREANSAGVDTTVRHFGDVWLHDALMRIPPCSLSLVCQMMSNSPLFT